MFINYIVKTIIICDIPMKKIIIFIMIISLFILVGCSTKIVEQIEDQKVISKNQSQDKILEADCCSQQQKEAGFRCIRDCGPSVIPSEGKYDISYSCLSPDQIENRERYGCPICLSSHTKISTPKGEISVKELKPGTLIWTIDGSGKKLVRPILKVSASLTPKNHKVI